MPELPEVETIAANLRQGRGGCPILVGRAFLDARVLWPRSLADPGAGELSRRIAGQRILQIGRRAKYLVFSLTRDTLLLHLRMSGDLLVSPVAAPENPHVRLSFSLEDGLRLDFVDARKFGRAWLTASPEAVLAKLGPEPLEDDFTPELLAHRLHRCRRQLKPLLLDQSFIAGLGNIYTDEALHRARLHPLVISDSLGLAQVGALWAGIRSALQDGIQHNGASLDWVYRGGNFQNYFQVYQRDGQPCPDCGTIIKRLVVGQRGTHFCPRCQPAPEDRGGAS